MSTRSDGLMLDADDLAPADEAVLSVLADGRVTAPYASEETEYTLQYVRDVLTRLTEHGHVRKVYTGLYELEDDPRTSGASTMERASRILEEIEDSSEDPDDE